MGKTAQIEQDRAFFSRTVETIIRVGIIAVLVIYCFQIVRPFIIPVVWGVIIAVAAYPGFLWLKNCLAVAAPWRRRCLPC